jgi:hypothetical protein
MQDRSHVLHLLIGEFHQEFSDRFPPVSVEKMVHYVGDHIINGALFVARDADGTVVGAIAGRETEYWFSTSGYVREGFYYVSARARASRAAVLLLRSLKAWAAQKGMPLICGVSSADQVERKDRFFERNGMRRIGGLYVTV